MAERDKRAPRIRPVRTVNHVRPDYGGNVNVTGYDDSDLIDRIEDLEARTAGHIIRDEGDDLPQRPWLDFVGEGVTVTDFGGVTRVSIPGGVGGTGADDGHIDLFTGIEDDTVSAFTLTYAPRNLTWNVDLNGVQQQNGVDYSIDAQVLTVTDPTDLFAGASASDTWSLQVQYHKANDLQTPTPVPPEDPETPGFEISGNTAICTAISAVALLIGEVVTEVQVEMTGRGVLAVASIGNNTILWGDVTATHTRIFKTVAGVDTQLATAAYVAPASFTMKVTLNQSTGAVEVFIDGVSKVTHTLSAANLALFDGATSIGLRADPANSPEFDNLYANGVLVDDFNRADADRLGEALNGEKWAPA